jgi:hypothetical protein
MVPHNRIFALFSIAPPRRVPEIRLRSGYASQERMLHCQAKGSPRGLEGGVARMAKLFIITGATTA